MSVSLDPRKAHLVRRHGDILCIYTWVNSERAMILLPARRSIGSPWFIIMESAAFSYDDPRHLAQSARKAAKVLGMDQNTSTWYRIATIIHDGLPDLIGMPSAPLPEFHSHTIGEARVRADGVVIGGEEIRPEKAQVEYA